MTRESLDGVRFVDDIFVMGADGSSVARLTSQGESRDPIWSPNGRRILYAEGFAPGGPRAMVMLADGSDAAPLPVDSRGWTEPLAWSVDSNQVLLSAGNAQNGCSMLVVALSGGTTVLLRGGEPVYSSSPGETPSASGAACVESASWVGSGRN